MTTETSQYPLRPGTGVLDLEAIAAMSGLEVMQAIRDGRLPQAPITGTLDFKLVAAEPGAVTFEGTPRLAFYNPIGTIHGGWIGTLLDSCMGCAIHTTIVPGEAYTTLEYKVNCVKAVVERTGRVRAEGRLTSRGRRIATSEGRLIDAEGRVLALGTTTCLIFPLNDAPKK